MTPAAPSTCSTRRASRTEETFPSWLYKAIRNGVLVDVIFRSSGGVYLDAEMLARGQRRDYRGTDALLMSPEDLLVVKAMAATEETPHHWYDALALIARRDLDWDYVLVPVAGRSASGAEPAAVRRVDRPGGAARGDRPALRADPPAPRVADG